MQQFRTPDHSPFRRSIVQFKTRNLSELAFDEQKFRQVFPKPQELHNVDSLATSSWSRSKRYAVNNEQLRQTKLKKPAKQIQEDNWDPDVGNSENVKDLLFFDEDAAKQQNLFTSFYNLSQTHNSVKFLSKLSSEPNTKIKLSLQHNQQSEKQIRGQFHFKEEMENIALFIRKIEEERKKDQLRRTFQRKIPKFSKVNSKMLALALSGLFENRDDEKNIQLKSDRPPAKSNFEQSTLVVQDEQRRALKTIGNPSFYEEYFIIDSRQALYRPTIVESPQIVVVEDKLYLYGGVGADGLKDVVWSFCLKKYVWNIVKPIEYLPELARTSHSMCLYKGNLIVFGGSSTFNHKLKHRELFNSILQFTIVKQQWTTIYPNGEPPEPRRKHKAVIWANKYLLVVGGINMSEKMLDETLMFNLGNACYLAMYEKEQRRWCSPMKDKEFHQGISSHTLVVAPNNYEMHDHHQNKVISQSNQVSFQNETIYLFGGKNNQSQCNNELWKLQFEQGYFHIYQLNKPVYYHTAGKKYRPWEYHQRNALITRWNIYRPQTPLLQQEVGTTNKLKYYLFIYFHYQRMNVYQTRFLYFKFGFRFGKWSGHKDNLSRLDVLMPLHSLIQKLYVSEGSGNLTIQVQEFNTLRQVQHQLSKLYIDQIKVQAMMTRSKHEQEEQLSAQISQTTRLTSNNIEQKKKKSFDAKNLWDKKSTQEVRKLSVLEKFKQNQKEFENILSYQPVPKRKQQKVRIQLFVPMIQKAIEQSLAKDQKLDQQTSEKKFDLKQIIQ